MLEETSDCGRAGLSGEKLPFLVLWIKTGRGIWWALLRVQLSKSSHIDGVWGVWYLVEFSTCEEKETKADRQRLQSLRLPGGATEQLRHQRPLQTRMVRALDSTSPHCWMRLPQEGSSPRWSKVTLKDQGPWSSWQLEAIEHTPWSWAASFPLWGWRVCGQWLFLKCRCSRCYQCLFHIPSAHAWVHL